MVTIRRIASIQEAVFWENVVALNDCWTWKGPIGTSGYGVLGRYDGRKTDRAHRYAWELASGEVLTGHDTICHTCDTPRCVRNDEHGIYTLNDAEYPRYGHLYKATQPVNVADRDAKGRGHWATGEDHGTHTKPESLRLGERHGNAKLTDDAVRDIRAQYTGKYGELAMLGRKYNVSPVAIRRVAVGKGWTHVGQ